MIERFSKHRYNHEPSVTDDPLLPDGSSHGYASLCKINGIDDFMAGLNEARWDIKPWHTNIYAGWPHNPMENLEDNINHILDWMMPFDRMIYVDCYRDSDHILCYLRNEATMDRDRWYGMLGINGDSQLSHRLRFDIEDDRINENNDPRMIDVNIDDILVNEPQSLWDKLSKLLGWPMIDYQLFVEILEKMRKKQEKFYQMVDEISPSGTSVQKAIYTYLMEKNNGS